MITVHSSAHSSWVLIIIGSLGALGCGWIALSEAEPIALTVALLFLFAVALGITLTRAPRPLLRLGATGISLYSGTQWPRVPIIELPREQIVSLEASDFSDPEGSTCWLRLTTATPIPSERFGSWLTWSRRLSPFGSSSETIIPWPLTSSAIPSSELNRIFRDYLSGDGAMALNHNESGH